MKKENFIQFLMHVFTPRRPVELLLKPAATLALLLCVYVVWEVLLVGWTPIDLPGRLLALALTQLPFMSVAFILVVYLDRLQSDLADLAMTDVLTDLPNRRAFIRQVNALQDRGDIGHLLIIDADHFKKVNDTYGHPVGDACLQAIAERLQSLQSPNDVIGRIGGEEFGAYFPYSTEQDIILIGRRMCQTILVEHSANQDPLRLTLSVGATETRPKEKVDMALTRADAALYAAKEGGRAQLVLWTQALSQKVA